MGKLGFIICDWCKKALVHPALLDVNMKCRFNLPLGFMEVEVKGDFCDLECLGNYAHLQAVGKKQDVEKADQSIFFRGVVGESGQRKSGEVKGEV